MRATWPLFLITLLLCVPGWCDQGHDHPLTEQELGSVHFATSCAATVAAEFDRAVALLHSFQYESARNVFSAVARKDPRCAMAEWGIAMSHYHGLWENSEFTAGRGALAQARQRAASFRTSPREMAYINALGEIFSEDGRDRDAHAQAFERRMAALHAAYPKDDEAAIFHALALAISAPKTDRSFANQKKCGDILEPLFHKYPHHPGVAHYLIHCYDNPVLAERGLTAARAYARIAPSSAHALHMPTHIFTLVGSWDESVANNVKSAESAAGDEAHSQNGEARDQRLHALDYLEYAYLQSGRVRQARAIVDQAQALAPVSGLTLTGQYATAAIPARYALELGDWKSAGELQPAATGAPSAQAITWMAVGVGCARNGKVARAGAAEQALQSLRDAARAQKDTYWANQIEVQRREVAAWLAQQAGKPADALDLMRSAADLEESMNKHAVTPGPITPAREMLAQLLAEQHQPTQALAAYQAVLTIAPNRFNALYGAGNAADAAGDRARAAFYYRKLIEVGSGDERPELKVAAEKAVSLTANQ